MKKIISFIHFRVWACTPKEHAYKLMKGAFNIRALKKMPPRSCLAKMVAHIFNFKYFSDNPMCLRRLT